MMIKRRNKKGNILTENIIFIVLNLIFLSILILFLFSKAGDSAVLEEKYAKQIALIIDSAEPLMKIEINMEDAIAKAVGEKYSGKIVTIDGNVVTVKLKEKGGYSYSFFNEVDVEAFQLDDAKYRLTINEKVKDEENVE